jgi:hypothetical protein
VRKPLGLHGLPRLIPIEGSSLSVDQLKTKLLPPLRSISITEISSLLRVAPPLSRRVSTTSCVKGRKTFKITHPFIPQYQNEYEFIDRRLGWGEDRVLYLDENGNTAMILTCWTDVKELDLFSLQSAGRSDFKYSDLVELSKILKYLKKQIKAR